MRICGKFQSIKIYYQWAFSQKTYKISASNILTLQTLEDWCIFAKAFENCKKISDKSKNCVNTL